MPVGPVIARKTPLHLSRRCTKKEPPAVTGKKNNPGTQGAEVVFSAGRPLVRRDVVHVQDLLNNIVNLSEHENANFFLPLGRREQNESRDHGANVDGQCRQVRPAGSVGVLWFLAWRLSV